MTTLMFLLAASLLVICLLNFAAILGLRTTEYEAAVQRLDESREEASRATCELEVAKLSLKNAQDQFADQLDVLCGVTADREKYRDALKDVARRLLYAGDVLDEVVNEGKFASEDGQD